MMKGGAKHFRVRRALSEKIAAGARIAATLALSSAIGLQPAAYFAGSRRQCPQAAGSSREHRAPLDRAAGACGALIGCRRWNKHDLLLVQVTASADKHTLNLQFEPNNFRSGDFLDFDYRLARLISPRIYPRGDKPVSVKSIIPG
jgi:hypothetical protein